jgi:hypothetical protein
LRRVIENGVIVRSSLREAFRRRFDRDELAFV